MKINNSTIITFFIIYVTCIDKSKNVEIIFIISNIFVTVGMCEKKTFENYLHVREMRPRKSALFFRTAQFFLAGTVKVMKICQHHLLGGPHTQ
jgi:hypothetical protein